MIILDESMTFNSVLQAIRLIAMRRNNNIVWQVEGIILRDGNYGVGAYSMEWVHKRDPERSCVSS